MIIIIKRRRKQFFSKIYTIKTNRITNIHNVRRKILKLASSPSMRKQYFVPMICLVREGPCKWQLLNKKRFGERRFLKVKILEIFTFRRRCSIDLLINVNLRYKYPARYQHLLFLRYFLPSVIAGTTVLSQKLHCALRESDGRIKDEPKWNF